MKTILTLVDAIRSEVVVMKKLEITRFHRRRGDWFALDAAMSYLEDTGLALLSYQKKGLGGEDGGKYLRLYGFFQAVFLQQDAIRHLYKEFVGSDLKYPWPSGWNEIRALRNLTAGHPINSDGHRNAFVLRVSISDMGFAYEVVSKKTGKFMFKEVNFLSLFGRYRKNARHLLAEILREIRSIPYDPDRYARLWESARRARIKRPRLPVSPIQS
jgi:hypothetical protein